MKPIKRKLLDEEILSFNMENNFIIERYFNPNKFIGLKSDSFKLWIDHSYDKIAEYLIIRAIYYDYSKNIESYESFENIEELRLLLPKEGILKHNEISTIIKTKESTKVLWKLIFQAKPSIISKLHISISD